MITINLLPVAAFRKRENAQKAIIAFFVAALGCIAFLAAANLLYLKPTIAKLEEDKQIKQSAATSAKSSLTKQVAKTVELIDLTKSVGALTFLESQRRATYSFLKELNLLIPSEDAWLTSCQLFPTGRFVISGNAKDHNAFANFLRDLENNFMFDSVNLSAPLREASFGGAGYRNKVTISSFTVNGYVNYLTEFRSVLFDGLGNINLISEDQLIQKVKAVDEKLVENYENIRSSNVKGITGNIKKTKL